MRKILIYSLALCTVLSSLPFASCNSTVTHRNQNVLRIASWDEYIDEGGDESYVPGSAPLYEEFEVWYKEKYGEDIEVDYISLQDNETMYNMIQMGDSYDLLCPSEYMIMKLIAENRLKAFPSSFFDTSVEGNYYAQNVSPYIRDVFTSLGLSSYAAGYMWGTTGFVFNPEEINRDVMKSWQSLKSKECERKITAKDNVRDSYFMGLGMYYEEELLGLKAQYERGEISLDEYKNILSNKMNDTSPETMNKAKKHLEEMRGNLYGLETDEAKIGLIRGQLHASYQWSGDAVFILDEAEGDEDTESPLYLEYSIPEAASNLWFDGWVMMDGISEKNERAALAFINFLSQPINVKRNMYYIGYTSCIGGSDVFDYVAETYGADDGDYQYDLSYFFGEGSVVSTYEEQSRRQLFAQYPDTKTIDRLVVMKYFDPETNVRANRMWNNIK